MCKVFEPITLLAYLSQLSRIAEENGTVVCYIYDLLLRQKVAKDLEHHEVSRLVTIARPA